MYRNTANKDESERGKQCRNEKKNVWKLSSCLFFKAIFLRSRSNFVSLIHKSEIISNHN